MKRITVKRSELATVLKLSESRIDQLVQAGTFPKPVTKGAFDLIGCTQAYVTFLRSKPADLAGERVRWLRAKADKEELLLRQRAGELVEVAKAKQLYFERGRQIRDSILSIPDRLAGIIAAEMDQSKVHALLTKELHQALEALTADRSDRTAGRNPSSDRETGRATSGGSL